MMEPAMVSVKLFIMCISTMFLAIIGVYIWTFNISQGTDKKLGEIYKIINGHIQKADIHANKKEFVAADVCNIINTNISNDLAEIKKDVKTLIKAG